MAERTDMQIPVAEGLSLWLAYYQRILAETEELDRSVIHYETVVMESQSPLRRLLFWLELTPSDDQIAAAIAVPQRSLYRSRAGISDLQAIAPPEVLELYARLCLMDPIYARLWRYEWRLPDPEEFKLSAASSDTAFESFGLNRASSPPTSSPE
jgi:hypothetical protein